MRGLRHPYLWGRDHPLVVDVLFALVIAGLGLLTDVFPGDQQQTVTRDPDAVSVSLTLIGTVPLVLRRRYPVAVYLVISVAATWYYIAEYQGAGPMVGVLVGLYGVAAHSGRATAVWALAGTIVTQVGGTLIDPSEEDTAFTAIAVAGILVAAWVIGDNIRVRRAYVTAVEDRAAQLEREQDAQARRAVLEERSRIARELHDIVAHSMSVMVVQAGAARRTLGRDPDRAVEAMSHIESTGRDALAEMRRVVAVLRSDGDGDGSGDRDRDRERGDPVDLRGQPVDRDALLPQPGLDELTTLVEQCREAGLPVELEVDGEVRSLPSGMELAVYRIVQEALTNTMRHAGPARAHVRLCFGEDGVTVTVVDDGRGASATSDTGPGSVGDGTDEARHAGHGLAGMHERVGLYGGRLTAGPRTGGGFSVQAEIPLPDDAATKPRPAGPSRLLTGWWAS